MFAKPTFTTCPAMIAEKAPHTCFISSPKVFIGSPFTLYGNTPTERPFKIKERFNEYTSVGPKAQITQTSIGNGTVQTPLYTKKLPTRSDS